MRIIIVLALLALFQGAASANNFYQDSNPFPELTCPQNLNNLYEAEPSKMAKEQKASKKWFKKGKNFSEEQIPTSKNNGFKSTNEGIIVDDGFVFFQNEESK